MNSLVGLANVTLGQSNGENGLANQDRFMDDCVVTVCRALLSKEKEMSPSRRSSEYARLVIEVPFSKGP